MVERSICFLAIFSLILFIPILDAHASDNPNLFVSAENPKFDNHFFGSMVVEVVIRDNDLRSTDEGKGEPDVTLNGKDLRMVQATDGNWYAYFANVEMAKSADSTVGLTGEGLDFGSICTTSQGTAAIGVDFSDADDVAYPYDACNGTFNDSNNVVRKAKNPSNFPNPGEGQIGIVQDAWPFIQLFSFSNDVTIQYNPAGQAQRVNLEYDDIPNISFSLDRDLYPQNSEVFVTVNDFQLNQDPTDEDSWTFNIDSPVATFYQAFDNNGRSSADGTVGLVNLVPELSNLGFEDNGILSAELNSVIELRSNSNQNDQTSVDDGSPPFDDFSRIITLVEKGPNSGIFESFDFKDQSTLGIEKEASRGQAGTITYNDDSISVLTGFSTASVSLQEKELTIENNSALLSPGTEYSINLVDPDQNINSGSQDDLDAFRDSSLLPTIKIGSPVTLENSSNLIFYPNSNNFLGGESVNLSKLDPNSERVFVDTIKNSPTGTNFKQLSLNLGLTSSQLRSILIENSNSGDTGTNWINFDFRSFEQDFELDSFSTTSIDLYFDSLSSAPITIASPGDLTSPQDLIQLDDNVVSNLLNANGQIFLVINFGSSDISISNESKLQPIIFDLFSFGLDAQLNGINNSIYRFELEETADNSSIFEGTFEYSILNQLNILDANFIKNTKTIGDNIEFIITDRSIDEEGISISYSDLNEVGLNTTTSTQSDIFTHSGTVSTGSNSYRFGQSVVVILNDPDLNLKSDKFDVYQVINDPFSPHVDTVGKNGIKLLEILIKDVRYQRCLINGVEHGGLGSTGFSLVETGPATGIFEGSFKMPTKICNKSGTQLISPAGGSIELKYFDSRDDSGESTIVSSLNNRQVSTTPLTSASFEPQLSITEFTLPNSGTTEEVVLSGSVKNQKRGIPLSITLIHPNGNLQEFNASVTSSGNYKTIFTINSNSLPGQYRINLEYNSQPIGSLSFEVLDKSIPSWIKDNARWWSSSAISDSEFIDGIEYLLNENIISISSSNQNSFSERTIPSWVKDNAHWWANNEITEDEFIQALQYLIKSGIIRV